MERQSVEKKALSGFLVLTAATLLAALGVASFLMADYYHVSPLWAFLGWLSLLFVVTVGKDLRSRFRSPAFVGFFLIWLTLHLLLTIFVVAYLHWIYWLPVTFLELWIGYTIAFWLFGLPPNPKEPGAE
ncbi:MAG: hypothetical protein M3O85_02705 [Acidobacteriota bacterium]|nr:hypothetical protein [Acidobacteriota bacterium]